MISELNYPTLYKGEKFEDGYKGCRILVLGHQAPANGDEEDTFENNRAKFVEDYKNNNIELVKKDILDEEYKDWKKEDRRRTNTWKKFINIIHYPYKPNLDSPEAKDFLHRIAFANYLTKPCFNKNRIGTDTFEFYTNDLEAFKHYIDEAFADNDKPNIVIAWGVNAYPHIHNYANNGDDTHCVLKNEKGATVNVIKITHPMVANQQDTHNLIEKALKEYKKSVIFECVTGKKEVKC
ncbi:MAG: hypothetical protein II945_09385 [Bacteroidales bacterium]|nr:hypothetical protein [Bacteroidales bacterium]